MNTIIQVKEMELARDILGDNLLDFNDLSNNLGIIHSPNERQMLTETFPFDDSFLMHLKEMDYIVTPTPTTTVNFCDVEELCPAAFRQEKNSWRKTKDSYRKEMLQPMKWLAIKKGCFPGLNNKPWDEQQCFCEDTDSVPTLNYVPTMIEVCYAYLAYVKIRCELPLQEGLRLRTSTGCSEGLQEFYFSYDNSLSVVASVPEHYEDDLGVAAGIKI